MEKKRNSMRILLRQAETGLYLQPSGEWTSNRETARTFATSVLAYYWAKEQHLIKACVLLAFNNPAFDIECMCVR